VKVQILVGGNVVATQLVSIESFAVRPPMREIKRLALQRALEDKTISISQSLTATFQLFDVVGKPMADDADEPPTHRAYP
jgi:hypothetical protein